MKTAPWLPLPVYIFPPAMPATLLLFYLLAYAPGTWLLRPFKSTFGGMARRAAALLLGWAFYTFFADITLKAFGPTLWGFYLAPGLLTWICAAAVRLSTPESGQDDAPSLETTGRQALFACLLGVVAVLQVIPVEWNGAVYWGTPEIDWRSRLPVTNAIAQHGLPAPNPFFSPDGDSKLFFYYGFFLLPAACVHASSSGAGWDVIGVMAFCVFLVGTMVALFALALGNLATGDKRGGWVSGLLCYVTGLDLLPVMALTLRGTPPSSIEWWNPAQITAVTAFPVWVPHHTLASLDVILAHVLAWRLQTLEGRWRRGAGVGVLAILLAAAAMTSTYVAMLGFLSIFLHGLLQARRLGSWRAWAAPMTATVLGGLLVLPFYYQLSKLDEYRGPSIQPILRPCPSEEPIRDALASTLGVSLPVALFLTRLGGLFPQYFFELGFLFFVLVFWKRTGIGPRDPDGLWHRFGVMVVVAFVVGSVFVSVRTWNCDLNWRIMHPVQIALLGAAAAFWRDFRSKPRPRIDRIGLAFFLGVGAASTAYDLVRSRWDYLSKPAAGEKTRDALLASTWVNGSVPVGDRIAIDPRNFGGPGNEFFGHLLRRQLVIADDSFNAFPYGPHPDEVRRVAAEMAEVFSAKTPVERRRATLRRYNVSYVLLDRNSELFDQGVQATFGQSAFVVNDVLADRWKVIQCATGPFK